MTRHDDPVTEVTEDPGGGCGSLLFAAVLLSVMTLACSHEVPVERAPRRVVVIDSRTETPSVQACSFMSHAQPCEPCPGGQVVVEQWRRAR